MKKILLILISCLLVSSSVIASNTIKEYSAKENNCIIEINGEIQDFELPVVLINGYTYIPVRQLCDKLGYKVDWIENGNKIKLSALKTERDGECIMTKETALKIGRTLLEAQFPDVFLDTEVTIDAEEKDGVWRVHNVIEKEHVTEDGKIMITNGGEIYVEFLKCNGEILEIGVDD